MYWKHSLKIQNKFQQKFKMYSLKVCGKQIWKLRQEERNQTCPNYIHHADNVKNLKPLYIQILTWSCGITFPLLPTATTTIQLAYHKYANIEGTEQWWNNCFLFKLLLGGFCWGYQAFTSQFTATWVHRLPTDLHISHYMAGLMSLWGMRSCPVKRKLTKTELSYVLQPLTPKM